MYVLCTVPNDNLNWDYQSITSNLLCRQFLYTSLKPLCPFFSGASLVYLSVCLYNCFSVCLSVCLFFCLFICFSGCLSVCISVFLSVCISVFLSVCFSVCLTAYQSVTLSHCVDSSQQQAALSLDDLIGAMYRCTPHCTIVHTNIYKLQIYNHQDNLSNG